MVLFGMRILLLAGKRSPVRLRYSPRTSAIVLHFKTKDSRQIYLSGFLVLKSPWRQTWQITFAGLKSMRSNEVTPVFSTDQALKFVRSRIYKTAETARAVFLF
jgi:hypothetical protein